SSTAGSATYGWVDQNNDHFAQANEVQLNNFISAAGGFNPNNPTAVTSANVLDPNLNAPVTASFVTGEPGDRYVQVPGSVEYRRPGRARLQARTGQPSADVRRVQPV